MDKHFRIVVWFNCVIHTKRRKKLTPLYINFRQLIKTITEKKSRSLCVCLIKGNIKICLWVGFVLPDKHQNPKFGKNDDGKTNLFDDWRVWFFSRPKKMMMTWKKPNMLETKKKKKKVLWATETSNLIYSISLYTLISISLMYSLLPGGIMKMEEFWAQFFLLNRYWNSWYDFLNYTFKLKNMS